MNMSKKGCWKSLFVLAGLFCMMFSLYTSAATSNAVCYSMTPSLTKAAFEYLDEIYTKKYPAMALRTGRYGTSDDKANLQKLADLITKDADTNAKKVKAVIDWALANITYDTETSALPQEVFYQRKGSCLGYASLIVELLRLKGIPSVMAEGWRGNMKQLTHYKLYNELGFDGHAWFFSWLNGQWVMYDPLFNEDKPVSDTSFISSWYYFGTIEGINISYPGMDPALAGGGHAYIYQDGRFMNIDEGKPFDGNSNNTINDLSMCVTTYSENCDYSYMDPSRTTDGMKEGELFRGGWFAYGDSDVQYAYENGIMAHATIMTWQGKDYYFNQGSSYRVMAPQGQYWISRGMFTVAPGFSGKAIIPSFVESSMDDPGYRITYEAADFGDTNAGRISPDGTFTALAPGVFQIKYENVRLEDNALMSTGYMEIQVRDAKPVPDYTFRDPEKTDSKTKDSETKEPETKAGSESAAEKKEAPSGTSKKEEGSSESSKKKEGSSETSKSGSSSYTVGKLIYSVEKKTAVVTGAKNKSAAALTIPATVKISGKKMNVTSIGKSAFKNMKKLKKVTIGQNVKAIRKDAFRGCGKLSTIVFKTKKLTARSMDAKAFAGTAAKAAVKIPKSVYTKYMKFLKKKGFGKKAKYKKY